MKSISSRTTRNSDSRRSRKSEKGQAALAIILGIVLVMVTVPLVADLLVTGQEEVVYTSQDTTQALQAAQAGLVDFENHVAADDYYASSNPNQGYCSADGLPSAQDSFIASGPAGWVTGGPNYPACDSSAATPVGDTDPNDPGFSNAFDPHCTTSISTNSLSAINAPDTSFAWDLYSGSDVNGEANSEYQFVVDSRAVNSGTINGGDAMAYVYVTGRAGVSGHYVCRTIKAAVNVLDPDAATAIATSAWGTAVISTPSPPPNVNQTVSFTITGASGASGGSGFFIKGGTGAVGATVTGTFTAPADWPGTGTQMYFGTWAGNAGTLGTAKAVGYDDGGAGGTDGGGGGASTVFCLMPEVITPATSRTCTSAMLPCPALNAATGTGFAGVTGNGCILAIASGGGGGGEGVLFFFTPGNGGTGGSYGTLPTAGGNALGESNGGGAATTTAGGTGGNGELFGFIPTKNGTAGTGTAPGTSGGAGATYSLGGDGGGGGGGYYGGGGGGAGFLIVGGGGGGGGMSWPVSSTAIWTQLNGSGVSWTYGTAPAGTKNGSGSVSISTVSNHPGVITTYSTGCTGTSPTANQTAAPPSATNALWQYATIQLAGGGGGGGGVPPEHTNQPYGEPGGIGGYIGGTDTSNTSAGVTITFGPGGAGSGTAPDISYEIGCGGGGGTANASSTVTVGDNAVALSALAGTLDVASSASFQASGQVAVATASGTAILGYTGIGTGILTGVTILSGTSTWTLATLNAVTQVADYSTVASGDNGIALSALAGTLDVASSSTFQAPGQVSVLSSGGTAVLAFTGTGAGTLTGVTLVSGTATWTLATGNAAFQVVAGGTGGGGYGAGGSGGIGKNAGNASNGSDAASGGGGGASEVCLGGGTATTTANGCGASTPTCGSSATGPTCILAIAAGGGGGGEGSGDAVGTTDPAGPGGPGFGGNVNSSCAIGSFEPGLANTPSYKNVTDTWYWPGDLTTGTVPGAPGGGGTQGTSDVSSGNGSAGSQAPCDGGGYGRGATTSTGTNPTATAGSGGSGGGGCSGSTAGTGAAGGPAATASCEGAGGGGGGGFGGGGAGGGSTYVTSPVTPGGTGYGGGGGSSYVYQYLNVASGVGAVATSPYITPTSEPAATPVSLSTTKTPFVPPSESQPNYTGPGGSPPVGSGAAGAGATSTSTTVGASGSSGQNGVLVITWTYQALGVPTVTDSCIPTTGVFAQGTGANANYTYFPELGPTTFEISGGSGGLSLSNSTVSVGGTPPTGGSSDTAFVTINVQPGEVFSFVQGCSGELSLGGAGFVQGGSSGPVSNTIVGTGNFGGDPGQYIGGTDTGGEAGGGGGASALCAGASLSGAVCNLTESLCASTWAPATTATPTTTQCVLAIAGGGGGAGAATWQNGASAACSAASPSGGTGGNGPDPNSASTTYNSGYITPGSDGSDGTASTVASGDNTVTLGALGGTLDVASSSSFTASGQVSVVTPSGTAVLAYTGTGNGTLTGVTIASGSSIWMLTTSDAVTQGAAGGDTSNTTGNYYNPGVTGYSSGAATGASPLTSTGSLVGGNTLYGTAGAGGGFEGGQAGQSLTECAGGGGSTWWLNVASGTNAISGTMTNPETGSVTTTSGSGTVSLQGFSTTLTAERLAALNSTSW
jgi:hypothetical protein